MESSNEEVSPSVQSTTTIAQITSLLHYLESTIYADIFRSEDWPGGLDIVITVNAQENWYKETGYLPSVRTQIAQSALTKLASPTEAST